MSPEKWLKHLVLLPEKIVTFMYLSPETWLKITGFVAVIRFFYIYFHVCPDKVEQERAGRGEGEMEVDEQEWR